MNAAASADVIPLLKPHPDPEYLVLVRARFIEFLEALTTAQTVLEISVAAGVLLNEIRGLDLF